MRRLTCIDLFCGCGGFTLGMQRAGFRILAAIDFDSKAVETLRENLVDRSDPALLPVGHVFQEDLIHFGPDQLAIAIQTTSVDVIVGGPPCQGFSTARQVDGANHGLRLKQDPRRYLYREFLRYVEFFQPRVFVMENVLGLRSAAGGEYFTRVQKEARAVGRQDGKPGYRVHGQVEDSRELGAPQKRRRQLIIGVRNDLPGFFPSELNPAAWAEPNIPLWATIGDLPALRSGSGRNKSAYNLSRRKTLFATRVGRSARKYLGKVIEIDLAEHLYNHIARPHSARDLRDFRRLRQGENSGTAMRDRGVRFEFPYDKSNFKDRYQRQSQLAPCSTIVAHLGKDGLMFIHPTQVRSLTPREAARIQTFPDWFIFPEARTHAFRLIGNAVPPIVAQAVGSAVQAFLANTQCSAADSGQVDGARAGFLSHPSVQSATEILVWLSTLDSRAMRELPRKKFLEGWHALLFLFPGLHPDNALDHGTHKEQIIASRSSMPAFEDIASVRYSRSGWPTRLESVGKEAWCRFRDGLLSHEEFYCSTANKAGLEQQQTV